MNDTTASLRRKIVGVGALRAEGHELMEFGAIVLNIVAAEAPTAGATLAV